jgi:hypothetical protein
VGFALMLWELQEEIKKNKIVYTAIKFLGLIKKYSGIKGLYLQYYITILICQRKKSPVILKKK